MHSTKLLLRNFKSSHLTQRLYFNQVKFSSTLNQIKARDQFYRDLLLTNNSLSENELSNIARVLVKDASSITEEEVKKFDDQALALAKNLDNQQLRQVISYYVFTNKTNKFVFYELKERNDKIGLKDYIHDIREEGLIQKAYVSAFQFRNCLFNSISKITGIKLR